MTAMKSWQRPQRVPAPHVLAIASALSAPASIS
jgi:hypothetical protein